MDKNTTKEDAVQLAEMFGLRKDEAEGIFEGMYEITKRQNFKTIL